ncbi:uncharacterized protein LOC128709218 [Anopheles marshallii]|uniref:uncharacterized protein LOC128709218 n=1 Tax=Anopheles marshallii TaxID=1521116 RepID=UPI00237C0478|nr:uncharacterized protein LOC128709218 [Anopheles marshallii]
MRMVSVRAIVLAVLLVTVPGDAFFLNMYRDAQNGATGMACRWYNMPPYANAIANQAPSNVGYSSALNGGGSLSYLTGLAAMLNRLYPQSIVGASPARPKVIVRVQETQSPTGNRNTPATITLRPGGNGNRELDYSETDPQYYNDDDGYAYDDYSDPDGYTDTVTYYDMPWSDARGTGNVFQSWYGTDLNAPSISGSTSACNVCATSSLLNLLMG